MKTYQITQANRGYLIRDYPEHIGMPSNEIYAFSTLKEAQAFLPAIFEPKNRREKKGQPND